MGTLVVKDIPDSWKLRLKELSVQHRRSMNQEALSLLGMFLEKHAVPSPKKLFKFKTPLTESYLAKAKRDGRL